MQTDFLSRFRQSALPFLAVCSLTLTACSFSETPANPSPDASPVYLALTVSSSEKSTAPDHLHVIYSDGTSDLRQELPDMWLPQLTQYGNYLALPGQDDIFIFNSDGAEVARFPKSSQTMAIPTGQKTSPVQLYDFPKMAN